MANQQRRWLSWKRNLRVCCRTHAVTYWQLRDVSTDWGTTRSATVFFILAAVAQNLSGMPAKEGAEWLKHLMNSYDAESFQKALDAGPLNEVPW